MSELPTSASLSFPPVLPSFLPTFVLCSASLIVLVRAHGWMQIGGVPKKKTEKKSSGVTERVTWLQSLWKRAQLHAAKPHSPLVSNPTCVCSFVGWDQRGEQGGRVTVRGGKERRESFVKSHQSESCVIKQEKTIISLYFTHSSSLCATFLKHFLTWNS